MWYRKQPEYKPYFELTSRRTPQQPTLMDELTVLEILSCHNGNQLHFWFLALFQYKDYHSIYNDPNYKAKNAIIPSYLYSG